MHRFQFTMRGLLWAMFWVAVALAAWLRPYSAHRVYELDRQAYIRAIVIVPCLCAAIGAVCNQHVRGILVGLIVVAGILIHITQYMELALLRFTF